MEKEQKKYADLLEDLIKFPINSQEYKKTISAIRDIEIGHHTLGLNRTLEAVSVKELAEFNYSIAK